MEGPNDPQNKNSLKSEHLREGVEPIMACVIFADSKERKIEIKKLKDEGFTAVDYYEDPDSLEKKGFLNSGRDTYVISTVDESNKFSYGFYDCTSLVVCGIDKETGENISFMTHQDPKPLFSMGHKIDDFVEDLRQMLEETKDLCEEGTVDVVIAGGKFRREKPYADDYLKTIELLESQVKEVFGFEPVVVTGPKFGDHNEDSIFFETENRRLYLIRGTSPDGSETRTTPDFKASEIEGKRKGFIDNIPNS